MTAPVSPNVGLATATGIVTARLLRQPDEESTLAMYEVTFAAGARTFWHSHPRGQCLFVTAGRARVQIEADPAADFGVGEHVWIPPGARHWHGATPDAAATHVAAQESGSDGQTVVWSEPVTDATYTDRDKR